LQRDQQLQPGQLHQQAAAFAAASASYEQQLFFASLAAAGAAAAGGAQAAAASPGNRGLSPMEMDAIATVAAASVATYGQLAVDLRPNKKSTAKLLNLRPKTNG
jgi:hypothetical protein